MLTIPFTPALLYFTLGFVYTSTLIFSHRTYDLSIAFPIFRPCPYLSITNLQNEIQARILQEISHRFFHAFISFTEYDRLTGGKWGVSGYRCRQCARHTLRAFEFALEDDFKNVSLERGHGACRALVGLFGEGWCAQELAAHSQIIRGSILKGVGNRTTSLNVLLLLFAARPA